MSIEQGNLFSPYRDLIAAQGEMFGCEEESDLACSECNARLIRTVNGWLACPGGHGKLCDASGEGCGSWFDEEGGNDDRS